MKMTNCKYSTCNKKDARTTFCSEHEKLLEENIWLEDEENIWISPGAKISLAIRGEMHNDEFRAQLKKNPDSNRDHSLHYVDRIEELERKIGCRLGVDDKLNKVFPLFVDEEAL